MNLYVAAEVQLHAFSTSAYMKQSGLFYLLAAVIPVHKVRKNSMSTLFEVIGETETKIYCQATRCRIYIIGVLWIIKDHQGCKSNKTTEILKKFVFLTNLQQIQT